MRPKQMARMGEFHLEEAILDVLLEAWYNQEVLGAAAIGKRAGIFRESGYAKKAGNDDIVWGMLGKLVKLNKIEKAPQNPNDPDKFDGWKLTEQEFDYRRDDTALD